MRRTALWAGLVALLLAATPSRAALPFRIAVEGVQQDVGVEASSPNISLSGEGPSRALGGSLTLDLPFGLRIGGLAARHLNEIEVGTDPVLTQAPDAVLDVVGNFELDATEFGGFVEAHLPLATWSIQDPYIGVGGCYARVEIDGTLRTRGDVRATSDLTGSADVYRVYGVGGTNFYGGFGMVARAGWAFHDGSVVAADGLRATGVPAGARFAYEGLFLNVGLVLRFE